MAGADGRGNQLFFASLCSFAWGEKELFLDAAASVMRRDSQVYLNACLEPRELICWYCLLCACVCRFAIGMFQGKNKLIIVEITHGKDKY